MEIKDSSTSYSKDMSMSIDFHPALISSPVPAACGIEPYVAVSLSNRHMGGCCHDEVILMDEYFFTPAKGHASPYINHFLQPDTLISDYTNPQTLNRYSYVGNRPVNFNDPTGHCPEEMAECRKILSDLLPKPEGGGGDGKDDDRLKDLNGQAQKGMASCIQSFGLDCGNPVSPPSTTGTPTPYTGPVITSQEPPTPYLDISVYVDWSKVDMIDGGIDVFGLGANGVALVAAGIPGGQSVAAGAEVVGGIVETAGLAKSGYELVSGNSSSMLLQQTTSQAERVAVMIARTERIAPGVGFFGNLVSLGINLKPQITIKWVTP